MANPVLTQPHFHNEEAAFAFVEARLWPQGPNCPHCGNVDASKIGKLNARSKPSKKNPEGVVRHGLRKCYACRKEFTVRVGTIFEDSHLALHLWLQAIHMLCSGKKGISTRHIQRLLNCSMKTAWFLTHRIREIMRIDSNEPPLGGEGKMVEADETYTGQKYGHTPHAGYDHKMAVLSLVERGGKVRSFHIEKATIRDIVPIVRANIAKESTLQTDEAKLYLEVGTTFADHQTVAHKKKEYVRGLAHTNTIEGFFGIFKRGMRGVYHQCSEAHLHRYLAEFDFRYNNRERYNALGEKRGMDDVERAAAALKGAKGKRLTYRRINERAEANTLG